MDNWDDAKAGRAVIYVIAGLAVGLFVMLMLVLVYAGQSGV